MSVVVGVRPPGSAPGSNLLRDGFFGEGRYVHFGEADHWLDPYRYLRQVAAREGFDLATEDLVDLDKAAALILMDIPVSAREIEAFRRRHPQLKVILRIIESPLGRLWMLDPANHRMFDAVVSYDDRHSGQENYFVSKIPAGGIDGWSGPLRDDPWSSRRLACMVAVMKPAPTLPRNTGIGLMKAGWRFKPRTWLNYVTQGGSLYGERIAVADALAKAAGEDFDIFGPNWSEVASPATKACVRGPAAGSKLDFLGGYRFNIAFENCRNDCGYISEKIFDPMLAGTVPVYLGNTGIERLVPKGAFVDARDFKSYPSLAEYLKAMPQAQWQSMRQAGADYLRNDAALAFGAAQNAAATLDALRYAVGSVDVGR